MAIVAALGIGAATVGAAASAPWPEVKLIPSDGVDYDYFGQSVAVADGLIVVGSPHEDSEPGHLGSVYVFTGDAADGYTEAKLTGSDSLDDDGFGAAVAVSGGKIVVGARGSADKGVASGSVYVFEPDGVGGYAETKLTAGDGEPLDRFGTAVAVSAGRIVVGAPGDADEGVASGSVYVFEPDGVGGYDETKLTASDGEAFDSFGLAVSVAGDRIVVGAYGDDDRARDSGAVYVFEPDGVGGYDETKITASNGRHASWFGWSVAVSGDEIVVGARGHRVDGRQDGTAYHFDAADGFAETELRALRQQDPWGMWGNSVAVSGERIVVGRRYGSSVVVFDANGTGGFGHTVVEELGADNFGWSVAAWDDLIVVGSPEDDDAGRAAGAVHVFEIADQPIDGCGGREPTVVATEGEAVVRGTPGDDVILGTDGPDVIDGGAGDDLICGLGGADTLIGGTGDDYFDGGAGRDTVTYAAATSGVRVTIGDGANDGEPGEADDVTETVEIVRGSRFADTLIGSDDADVLRGLDGRDRLRGGGGDDRLYGGDGGDILHGGSGRDHLDGGAKDDICRGGGNIDTASRCEALIAIP